MTTDESCNMSFSEFISETSDIHDQMKGNDVTEGDLISHYTTNHLGKGMIIDEVSRAYNMKSIYSYDMNLIYFSVMKTKGSITDIFY